MNSNPPTTPVLVFDFGGVLIDWDPRYLYQKHFPGDPEGMERFLEEVEFTAWNLRQDAGRPFAEGVAEHCDRFPEYARLIRAYDEHFRRHGRHAAQLLLTHEDFDSRVRYLNMRNTLTALTTKSTSILSASRSGRWSRFWKS